MFRKRDVWNEEFKNMRRYHASAKRSAFKCTLIMLANMLPVHLNI